MIKRTWLMMVFSCLTVTFLQANDTLRVSKRLSFLNTIYQVLQDFTHIDTNYIEPQHYNFTVMLQNTNTYEVYRLRNKAGQEVVLAPEPSVKIGPYVGWRWLVLGYTIDVSHLFDRGHKQDIDLSLYSNQMGIDLFYRTTGDDYKIRRTVLDENGEISSLRNIPFDGFHASIKGFNLYYILNHQRFSYPAAFNQSTCQKVSCGSPLIGIGFTRHSLDLNVERLANTLQKRLDDEVVIEGFDSSLVAAKVHYSDLSISGGYAYNWVFARNWLAAASLSAGLGYKRTTGDMEHERIRLRDFSFNNFNIDGVGRFGMVWNNTRWYAGWSVILHAYRYRKSQFSTNSVFGSANFYTGYNFGARHRSQRKKYKNK